MLTAKIAGEFGTCYTAGRQAATGGSKKCYGAVEGSGQVNCKVAEVDGQKLWCLGKDEK